ncbi:MAG: PadR family transcriptional regulator [Corynebacterium sp.]|nr:PadR family transcriptional regulator [Corynebacterium sp.]
MVGKIEQWVETYKKSMLTPAILSIVAANNPCTVAEIAAALQQQTQWQITERGLYRTIKRLENSDFLVSVEVAGQRTGKKKKEISITDVGEVFLAAISDSLIELE